MDFTGKRHWYFLLSALILLPGVISLLIPPSLKPGIDFTSGSSLTVKFEQPVEQGALHEVAVSLGHRDAIVQPAGEGAFIIRTKTLEGEQRDAQGAVIKPDQRKVLDDALKDKFGAFTVLEFDSVSPVVAAETVIDTGLAMALAVLGMLVYMTVAFWRQPKPFRYGVCATITLIHDVLVVVGVFSLMGKFLGTEVNFMFVAALLTVIGYAINDTIVVFDRIRENTARQAGNAFEVIVNNSLVETLTRSLNTGLCVLFALLAIYLFGGVTIRDFVLVLLIGITSGTYGSIFIASQLLVVWENGDVGRFWQRRVLRRATEG